MSITSRRSDYPVPEPHVAPTRTTATREDLSVLLGRLPLLGLLAVQAAIGYEWVMSGFTKIARGGFPAGLADELREKSEGAPGWYRTVIDDVLIPNGRTVGYLTEVGELLIGLVLVGAAAAFIFAPDRMSRATQQALFGLTAVSAFLALVMNVNFHLANGSAHPWLIPADGFDEGVDLDSLMPFIEITIIVVSLMALGRLHAARATELRLAESSTR
jgi:uncharacterized membrane protein YphA (DoxX/SURF4 family)